MLVAGVDGCPAGWLIVLADDGTTKLRIIDVTTAPDFSAVLAATRECEAVGIDIPIGLTDDQPRQADLAARKVLGPRASSVFPAPVRCVLDAKSYEDACTLSFEKCGRKISKQAFMITPKIRQVDLAMTPDPSLQEWFVEVHPEVCFWALNNKQPMRFWKKTPDGLREREVTLSPHFDDDIAGAAVPRGSARDDLYDACAAAWTAARYGRGEHGTLPEHPPLDSRGLRMEIVY